ncbi:hypothetical protein [Pedobacter sp. ASV28]|uniref:hypothetical protein n=1 Tax=Pedobacter sp. ASV28 TaxID=2795123 RepID=UPI0018EE4442|nr:hypothetical protein [Pedobacter sp. ASV28]
MKKIIALLLCLFGASWAIAQENTSYGTGALAQANTLKYAIKEINIVNPGTYSRPTINFGSHTIEWEYLYMDVSSTNGLYIEGYIKSAVDLGSFVPSLVGGHGTGAILEFYLSWSDGVYYYYELYTSDSGTGYAPQVSITPTANNSSFTLNTSINETNALEIYYVDYSKTNTYTVAPTVLISFGGATALAVLESTAANGQNTAIGYQALYNANSSDNVAVGNKAGYELTTGKNNTFIGAYAGKGITTGSGNTIVGATSSDLPGNLTGSVLLADGNGNNRLYFSPNGNALLGYGNTFTDAGHKLDVNGNARIQGKVYAQDMDAYEVSAIAANKVIEATSSNRFKFYQTPTSKTFHDVLAFNKKGYQITYEESADKTNFVPATLNNSLFSQRTGTAAQIEVINGSSTKAARWTWGGMTYTNAMWLALDYGYCAGTYVNIKIEHSQNNVNWTTLHNSTYFLGSSGVSRYHWLNGFDESDYLRLTMTHNSGNVVRLSGIRLLTTRLGNHGAAPEYAYPYTWNKDGWIGINKGIAEPEYPLDVNGTSRFAGIMLLNNEPATSVGSYEVLTRNSGTGAIEKLNVSLPNSGGFDLQGITDRGFTTTNDLDIAKGLSLSGLDIKVSNSNFSEIQAKKVGDSYDHPLVFQRQGGHLGIGTSTIDNAQGWDKVMQVHGNQHAKLLVTEGSGIKVGMFAHISNVAKIGTESQHDLTFTAGYWNDVMTLKTNGNVGIGTTAPQEKLSVNGKIRAREVKIEPTANWPDYVFEDSYSMPSLKELEAFIRQNKHLPEVPSAKEVAKEGLELGEMNKVLLKKIEELTLHLIQKEKELAETNKRIDQLAKMVGQLMEKK